METQEVETGNRDWADYLHAEIYSACTAISTLSEMDTAMMPKEDQELVIRTRQQSLQILAHNIDALHVVLFGEE